MNARLLSATLAVSFLLACRAADLSPAQGPQHGYFRVRAYPPRPVTGKTTVKVGARPAIQVSVSPEGDAVDFTVQGESQPGPQSVVLTDGEGSLTLSDSLTYSANASPHFERVVGFGASLSQGTQSAGVTVDTQLQSPIVQVARQAGAFMPLALFRPDLLDGIRITDFDERCELKASVLELLSARLAEEGARKLTDREGVVQVALARLDSTAVAQNVAIGGSKVSHVLKGPVGGSLVQSIFEHATWDLTPGLEALLTAPAEHQIDRIVALRPTVLISADLVDNDLIAGVDLEGSSLTDLDKAVPLDAMERSLDDLFSRMDALGAPAFLANMPPLELSRDFSRKLARLREKGIAAADISAWEKHVSEHTRKLNLLLSAQAKKRSWVHVVDLHEEVVVALRTGYYAVGKERLTLRPFGGLLSLDHFHFSTTGYAVLTNLFLREINSALGTRVPEMNLEAIHRVDPLAPANLRKKLPCAVAE
jgi:hypothetical protein